MQALSELTVTFILNAGWQIAAIFAVAALASWLLKNGPARYRHTLWIVALVASFVVPLLTATRFVPTWGSTSQPVVSTVRNSTVAKVEPQVTQDFEEVPALAQTKTPRTRSISTTTETTSVISILYALVVLGGIVRLARFWRRKEKLRRLASTVGLTAEIYNVAQRCRNVFTVSNAEVARSNQARVPYTLGARRPLILLPEAFCSGAGEPRLLSVIGHEMAHVARRDFLTNFICELITLPISFHPLTFLIKRQIDRTRELACDELVTTRLLPPRVYARSLLWAAAVSRQYTSRALMLSIFDGKILEERIMRLTKNSSRVAAGSARVVMFAALLVLCASAVSLSMFSLELQTQVRAELLQSLQRLNPPAAQDPVAPVVTTSQDPEPQLNAAAPENRSTSACAAGRRGDVNAIPALIGLLGDDTKTPLVKCWETGRWSPALQTFKHPSPGEQAAIALASFGRPAFAPLVNQLNSSNATVRRNAAWATGELTNMLPGQRSSAVPPLISLLTDADEWVRMAAARALGEVRDDRAVDQLVATLADGNWQVRQLAVWALSELKDERAVNSLCNVLLTDVHADVRRGAAEALGEIRSAEALPSLKQALNDSGKGVQAKAAWAISEIEG